MPAEVMTKDVTIKNREYQIHKLGALEGSYIAMTIATKFLPAIMQEEKMGLGELPQGRTEIGEEEFRKIQIYCLAKCKRYEGENRTPMSVMTTDGRFALPDLEYDIVTVLGLTFNSLMFSITPFFDDGGLDSVMKLVPDLSSPKAPAA